MATGDDARDDTQNATERLTILIEPDVRAWLEAEAERDQTARYKGRPSMSRIVKRAIDRYREDVRGGREHLI